MHTYSPGAKLATCTYIGRISTRRSSNGLLLRGDLPIRFDFPNISVLERLNSPYVYLILHVLPNVEYAPYLLLEIQGFQDKSPASPLTGVLVMRPHRRHCYSRPTEVEEY